MEREGVRLVWGEGRTTYVPALALKMHLNGVHDAPVLAVERENFGVQGRALRMGWQWCKAEGDNGTRGRPRAQAKGADPPDRGTYAGGHDEEEGYKKDLSVSLHSLKRDSVTMFSAQQRVAAGPPASGSRAADALRPMRAKLHAPRPGGHGPQRSRKGARGKRRGGEGSAWSWLRTGQTGTRTCSRSLC